MPDEPRLYPTPQADRGAIVVRGVCGAVLGLVVAIVLWMRCGGIGPWGSAALFAGCVLVGAIGAVRHGDAFWYRLLRRP